MIADGVAVEPRKSLFGHVETSAGHTAAASNRLKVAGTALWNPIVTALKPPMPHHS
jgi:hypothetical protein